MPRPTTTRSTALTLLALMGLVGVLGAGLHSLVHVVGGQVDCWWYGATPCCRVQSSASMAGEAHNEAGCSFAQLTGDGHSACPICTLLARYHAPPANTSLHATTALVHAKVAIPEPILVSWATPSAHRPRGPPAWN